MKIGITNMNTVSNQQMEEAVRNRDYIKLANSVFAKFKRCKLSADERRQIFLDAIWYSLVHWKPEKSAFQTFLCNNVWYKIQTHLKKKYKDKEKTNWNLTGLLGPEPEFGNDFENIIAKLHDNYKIPIIQRYIYGMSTSEIGEANGYNKSYANLMIKKGLEKLKKSV